MAINGKPFTGRDKKGKSIPIYISKNNLEHYIIQKMASRVHETKLLRRIRHHIAKFQDIGFVRIFPESAQHGDNYKIYPVTYYTTINHIGSYTKAYWIEGKSSTPFSIKNTAKKVINND